jgi:hypothetical protein
MVCGFRGGLITTRQSGAIFHPFCDSGFAFHVGVPDGSGLTGFVMCEQLKSVGFRARDLKRSGSTPTEFLVEVLSVIDACIHPKPA